MEQWTLYFRAEDCHGMWYDAKPKDTKLGPTIGGHKGQKGGGGGGTRDPWERKVCVQFMQHPPKIV